MMSLRSINPIDVFATTMTVTISDIWINHL